MPVSREKKVTAGEQQSKRYQEEQERDCGSDRRDARGDEVGLSEELSRAAHTHTHAHTLPKAQEGGENEETLGPSGPSQLL